MTADRHADLGEARHPLLDRTLAEPGDLDGAAGKRTGDVLDDRVLRRGHGESSGSPDRIETSLGQQARERAGDDAVGVVRDGNPKALDAERFCGERVQIQRQAPILETPLAVETPLAGELHPWDASW
jgi:hypothetical protein